MIDVRLIALIDRTLFELQAAPTRRAPSGIARPGGPPRLAQRKAPRHISQVLTTWESNIRSDPGAPPQMEKDQRRKDAGPLPLGSVEPSNPSGVTPIRRAYSLRRDGLRD